MGLLAVGEVFSERFAIESLAGSGGMAHVYRARDLRGGGEVALKVLQTDAGDADARFEREALVLAALTHPGIVGYVAHGRSADGRPFLAMRWVEGQTLSSLVKAGGPMEVSRALDLGIGVASALAAAHRTGIVHRDLKPSNLIVRPDGNVTLIDFGVVRVLGAGTASLTQAGLLVGTPAYVAPEQARGEATIDARADIFSLGCVLYYCLTGKAAFRGDDLVAVLAKILFQATPRVRDARKEVSAEVDALVAQLMAKDPRDRFADARAALAALERVKALGDDATSGSSTGVGISSREARLCAMLFVGESDGAVTPQGLEGATGIVERFGGALERLANGALAVRWVEAASVTERAVAAARCALWMRERSPSAPVSLATVRGGSAREEVVAAAIDRAAELVREAAQSKQRRPGVRIDETTAGLLDARFEVRAMPHGLELVAEHDVTDDARKLLGVAVPFVGRDREIALLDATLAQTEEDEEARAVLIYADAGVGKTRLRQEWLRRLRSRDPAPSVWLARGDPLGTRSAYGLVAQALRRAMGVRDDEPLALRQARVRERVAAAMRDRTTPAEVERVFTFIAELLGAPVDDEASPWLVAARRDRMLMGDQVRRAFSDFVRAQAKERPVVLVLEDPQWGDAATLRLVDAALANLSDAALLVVAFARPELRVRVPDLFRDRKVQEVRLEELSRKASERLVRAALPQDTPIDAIERVVSLAHGNAFFLEELVRAVADGRGHRLPDSVLAVVEARLETFDPEDRRVLRAASVFGQFFWPRAVAAVLGEADPALVASRLTALAEREVITRRHAGRFADEPEYAFRHSLLRDAAYATLVDDDRAVAHRAAATWLASSGEGDAGVLASHFEWGGDPAKAAEAYARAAAHTLEANDFALAIELAKRGLALGPEPSTALSLWGVIVDAERWRGDNEACVRAATELMSRAPEGSDGFCRALGAAVLGEVKLSHGTRAKELLDLAHRVFERDPTSPAAQNLCASAGVASLFLGDKQSAARFADQLARHHALDRADPATRAALCTFLAFYSDAQGDLEQQAQYFDRAAQNQALVGNLRSELMMRANSAFARALLGYFADAELALRDCLAESERARLPGVVSTVWTDLATVLEWRGKLEESKEFGQLAAEAHHAQGDRRMEAASRGALARALLRSNDTVAALREARNACDLAPEGSEGYAASLATYAYVCLKTGDVSAAMSAATRAYDVWATGAVAAGNESLVLLVYARALQAAGRIPEARAALSRARDRVFERAAKMKTEEAKTAFLTEHWDNAQTVEWASASGL